MKFTGTKNFACPQCGVDNAATEMQAHRGIKCAQCGTGYIPIKIETTQRDTGGGSPIGMIIWPAMLLVVLLLGVFRVLPWIFALFLILLAIIGAAATQFLSAQKK